MTSSKATLSSICILILLGLSVSSCDFFRKLAGRPTSTQLATLEWRRDSLVKAEPAPAGPAAGAAVSATPLTAAAPASAGSASASTPAGGPAAAAPATASGSPAAAPTASAAADSVEIARLNRLNLGRIVHPLSRYKGLADGTSPALFHMIGGTFKSRENATRYCERLKKSGFSQAKLLLLHNGLHLVSLYSAESAKQVQQFFDAAPAALPKDAWVLVNDIR